MDFGPCEQTHVFPTLLQQLIPKGKDYRITAVGRRLFGVEITTPNRCLDWRLPDVGVEYQPIIVGPPIAAACVALLDELSLNCGAFDFAVSPSGQWFFLEVNPVGEWAWLDTRLRLGIRDALIDLLCPESTKC